MVASMSRKGDCWDNAVAESFFATRRPVRTSHRTSRPLMRAESTSRITRRGGSSGTTSGPYQPGVASSAVDVESGLAAALLRAAEAGRFDVVALLARELETRRLARVGDVVRPDDPERGKR